MPIPTPWCSSYGKGSHRVTLDYGHQLYNLYCNWLRIMTFVVRMFIGLKLLAIKLQLFFNVLIICFFVWVLWHINLCWLYIAEYSFIVKQVLFQTIQFSIQKQFHFKQLTSILPIDRTLTSATTPRQSEPGSDGCEGYSAFPKSPALLEPHNQIVLCYIQDTRWRV